MTAKTIVIGDQLVPNGYVFVTVDPDAPYISVGFPQVGDPGTPTPTLTVSPLVTIGAIQAVADTLLMTSGKTA